MFANVFPWLSASAPPAVALGLSGDGWPAAQAQTWSVTKPRGQHQPGAATCAPAPPGRLGNGARSVGLFGTDRVKCQNLKAFIAHMLSFNPGAHIEQGNQQQQEIRCYINICCIYFVYIRYTQKK